MWGFASLNRSLDTALPRSIPARLLVLWYLNTSDGHLVATCCRVGDENILGALSEEIICFHEQVRLIDHCVKFASVSSHSAKLGLCRLS